MDIPVVDDMQDIIQMWVMVLDKGYDAELIRNYLKNRNIILCIPHRNFKTTKDNHNYSYRNYSQTRYVVERFFGWLKNGFHRTRIRYEGTSDNYLGFVCL